MALTFFLFLFLQIEPLPFEKNSKLYSAKILLSLVNLNVALTLKNKDYFLTLAYYAVCVNTTN